MNKTTGSFGNLVGLQFTAILCYLPLKSKWNPEGTYETTELYTVISNLVEHILYGVHPTQAWAHRRDLAVSMKKLTTVLTARIEDIPQMSDETPSRGPATGVLRSRSDTINSMKAFGRMFTTEILQAGTPVHETVEVLIGNAVAVVGTVGTVVCYGY